jgi:hypothetical protein
VTAPLRSWWRSCAIEPDPEILAIDRVEDELAPIPEGARAVRELILGLELCHHKADRWVHNIIEAIGAGTTEKGLGTRASDQPAHPAEKVWQDACAALSAWSAGCPAPKVDLTVGGRPAARLLARLGERSALKEWQVQRVVEKIRSTIHWPRPRTDPSAAYGWLLMDVSDYDFAYRDQCPERYEEHQDLWIATARTVIRDTEGGEEAGLSLGLAIDMLWPCHWRFLDNLEIVLDAIGGRLEPERPFAACGRNIGLLPMRASFELVADTLDAFRGAAEAEDEQGVGQELLALLGERTKLKEWLAWSLATTIRLQLDPPPGLRALLRLDGPEWVRQV